MRRYKKKNTVILTDIPLTPLIDTALTLLVIFIILAPSLRHGLAVSLPKTDLHHKPVKEELTIIIDKEGHYFWNDNQIVLNDLINQLKDKVKETELRTVFIKADKGVFYEAVLDLFEILSGIDGIDDVVLPTQKR